MERSRISESWKCACTKKDMNLTKKKVIPPLKSLDATRTVLAHDGGGRRQALGAPEENVSDDIPHIRRNANAVSFLSVLFSVSPFLVWPRPRRTSASDDVGFRICAPAEATGGFGPPPLRRDGTTCIASQSTAFVPGNSALCWSTGGYGPRGAINCDLVHKLTFATRAPQPCLSRLVWADMFSVLVRLVT